MRACVWSLVVVYLSKRVVGDFSDGKKTKQKPTRVAEKQVITARLAWPLFERDVSGWVAGCDGACDDGLEVPDI